MAIVVDRHLLLLALLAGAVVSYSVGFLAGFGLFLAAGVLLELAFWYQLFKRNRRRRSPDVPSRDAEARHCGRILAVGSTAVLGTLLAVGLVLSRTQQSGVDLGVAGEAPVGEPSIRNIERVLAPEPPAQELLPEPVSSSSEPRYPILLPLTPDDSLTLLFAAESKDPSWSAMTEAQILDEISRLSGLSLVTIDVECKATLCRVQSVLPTADAAVWHKIVGVAANLGLEAPLPLVAVNNASKTTVLLAYFTR